MIEEFTPSIWLVIQRRHSPWEWLSIMQMALSIPLLRNTVLYTLQYSAYREVEYVLCTEYTEDVSTRGLVIFEKGKID